MSIKSINKSTTIQDINMKFYLLVNISISYIATNFHVDAASRSDLISIFLTRILRYNFKVNLFPRMS